MTIEEKNELTDYILRLIRDRGKKNQEPDVFDLYSVLGHIVALRVEMKSEWSEEDEAALNKIIAHFDWTGNNRFTKDDCEWAQSWLKSLRPQNNWKPTDMQIKALEIAITFVTDDFGENPTLSETLRTLIEQLKKLKD